MNLLHSRSQAQGEKKGSPVEEGNWASQGSQIVKGIGQSSKGNTMITSSVAQVNPYKVQVLSIKPAQSGSDALARADVRVSVDVRTGEDTYTNESQDLYDIQVLRGKNRSLVVEAPWVPRPAGWGPYFVPQQGGLQQVAITKAVLAAYRAKIKGLGVR